ncbi:MAG TPA: hypothetical protein ENJ08_12440 [Gammaproteobacteria bacterium]|nr:hypothetical protein [Gammaproteobacteria bacterium]
MQKYQIKFVFLIFGLSILVSFRILAAEASPWGAAQLLDIEYKPGKALYDITTGDIEELSDLLSRIGLLYKLQGSDTFDGSIVVVVHGDAIPFFAMSQPGRYKDLMDRAHSLTVGTSIEFRMCRAAARQLNYEAKDIHGFVKMVPMADAEIVRLQHAGYAYMH